MEEIPSNSAPLISLLLVFIFLIPFVFYLITLRNTLKAVSAENRTMAPSQVWFMLIPFFGLIWHFIIVSKMSKSIKAEFLLRDIELKSNNPGFTAGLVMCISNCLALFSDLLGMISSVAALAFLVCWIIYWIQIASFKKQIKNSSVITLDAESIAGTG